MNYRHEYHAGHFSDVFKHLMLISLINAQLRKEKPFCYLESHSGRGLYDLSSEAAKKTKDADLGILRLLEILKQEANVAKPVTNTFTISDLLSSHVRPAIPIAVKTYLKIIESFQYPPFYPGSPLIAASLLREEDCLVLMELHKEEFAILKKSLNQDKRVACHQQDGYQGLIAFLPPKERRGLIFIDPPFEKDNEWDQMLHALKQGIRKFQNGVFVVWYPIKDLKAVRHFLKSVITLGLPEVVNIEFRLFPSDIPLGLPACGMLIVNTPWQFVENCHDWLPWLLDHLSRKGEGSFEIKVLTQ